MKTASHTESYLPHRPGRYFFGFSPDYLVLKIRDMFIVGRKSIKDISQQSLEKNGVFLWIAFCYVPKISLVVTVC